MIEVVISLGILGICIIILANIVKGFINSNETRLIKYNVNETLYAICSEVKYNVAYEDIRDEIKNNKLTFLYNEEFLSLLPNTKLLFMNKNAKDDEKIELELIEDNGEYMKINIKIIYKDIKEEQIIFKAPWMEYV
ncbi:hypothetical protein [Clostridium sp. HBUAS56017]|uniref:hypothetical protein n=1 Tax=Clostridium sp. HBUAS56017 TaxID=2571128 RepID=UPI001178C6ED|nr:hypothetical protein [Clostridium sp. HBUAS56017]